MIPSSKRNRRLQFQSKGKVPDGHGGTKDDWVTDFIIWGKYFSGGGNEKYSKSGEHAEVTGRFWFNRGKFTVTAEQRVFEQKPGEAPVIYDILSADLIKKDRILEVRVKSRV